MNEISGLSNWRLSVRREHDGVVLLRAVTCDKNAVLPDSLFGLPVTALGDRALAGGAFLPEGEEVRISCGASGNDWDNRGMEALSLPESLRKVGDYAFLNCHALRTLRLFDGVSDWGGGALMNCRNLSSFHLTRLSDAQGPSLAYLVGELSKELDVTVLERDGTLIRLLFPEYTELYEENCPAHHFDYSIAGAGYPYHHCFRQKMLRLNEYDNLWPAFLGMEHDTRAALRLAWLRLRWPAGLSSGARDAYLSCLREHLTAMLEILAASNDAEGIHFLLDLSEPDRQTLSRACAAAREHRASSALARLLEELHRKFPAGLQKRFDL